MVGARRKTNRDALLEAAVSCLKEKGYARTTARDLVDASGTNLGAIGYHFGSKEALLNQAMYLAYEEWLDQVAASALPADGSFWDALELAVEEALRTLETQRPLCVAFVEALAQAERSEELRQQMAQGYERYRRAVARYIDMTLAGPAEDDPSDAAMTLAALVVALLDGLLLQWLLDPNRVPQARDFTAAVRAAIARSDAPRMPGGGG